jgi:hypothetical protein
MGLTLLTMGLISMLHAEKYKLKLIINALLAGITLISLTILAFYIFKDMNVPWEQFRLKEWSWGNKVIIIGYSLIIGSIISLFILAVKSLVK